VDGTKPACEHLMLYGAVWGVGCAASQKYNSCIIDAYTSFLFFVFRLPDVNVFYVAHTLINLMSEKLDEGTHQPVFMT
jgi:hypothetical protein